MDLRDWRDAPAELLAPVYEAERQRWLRTLQWDSASSWREVEQARITWGLPGLIAMDGSGAVGGLTSKRPSSSWSCHFSRCRRPARAVRPSSGEARLKTCSAFCWAICARG